LKIKSLFGVFGGGGRGLVDGGRFGKKGGGYSGKLWCRN